MAFMFKNTIAPLVFASFLMAAFFGFTAMSNGPDGRMQGDCPFSVTGASLCPQDAVAAAVHHLSAYQSFLNVPVSLGFGTLISMFGLIGLALVLVASSPPVPIPVASSGVLYTSPPLASYNKKLIRWLSLFENSPSLR